MLKFECNKGTASISGSGSTAELATDVIACIYSVWKNISDKDAFKNVVKAAINDDVPFSEDMKSAEEKLKAKIEKKAEKAYKVLDEIKDMLKDAGFDVGDKDEAE